MTFTLICRSLILYGLILFLIRIMGKRQIGEMQPFELVITLIIADLATIPMAETQLPLIQGIIPLLTLVCVHYFICLLSRKSVYFRKIFSGKPVILLDPNGVNFENLRKVNMNFNDLTEGIHNAGYFNLEELLYVILQTNGTLACVNRAPFTPLTASDLKIEKDQATLPIIIVTKGKINKENMNLAKIDETFIKEQSKKAGVENIKDILIMTINNLGKIYLQPRHGKYTCIESNHTGGEW
ncbi:MAG: DUF421 domain-containing protein [Clostridia bacterium]|nr:DUF421 domain-containing protein [Clostridia bacterium]